MLNKFFIEEHVKNALQEDIGFGDITTDYLTTENDKMSCVLNTRVDGIFCGKTVFETVVENAANYIDDEDESKRKPFSGRFFGNFNNEQH